MHIRSINARFGFIQSIKNKEYFLHVHNIFINWCSANYNIYNYLDKRTNKVYTSLKFWTRALPIFTEFYMMFYSDKIKIVPISLDLLTPVALAHWIMQDRSFSSSPGIYLCTDNFASFDSIRLANYLKDQFKLKCTSPKAPGVLGVKGHLRIYISATSLPLLQYLVRPYMVPSMCYKIGL